MADFASSFQSQMKQFDQDYAQNSFWKALEQKTNLPKSYMAFGSTLGYLLLIFINVGGVGEILSNFAGFVIPTYFSLIALKTASTDDDTQLLTYWIVFAFLNVIEFWSKAILYLIPFYWFAKTIFLIYIALPKTGGALFVYKKFIDPLTAKYIKAPMAPTDNNVNSAINNATSKMASARASGANAHRE
ncbi:hypothetical protein TPHA_0K00580 [Tetrapisispora phaffii CBS 4417]|uniref:Protein YOP1 n=1 Tax=Tetrapisispora phaffii (strain ATCC 24235 / CBS 4417 / NBRC 1672 / NRRL Y-8282 / UCD 70-5) TaxID=1071381 RepID=G8BZ64_TETPH|nr:hypothetical protein TPHA_0K00580 [Tetrapisispora phaffii CBS 4417]CCE65192.1 hypothetical protein TPHA_0K00580 [Tetrapisispora phaffii CBS 4417]